MRRGQNLWKLKHTFDFGYFVAYLCTEKSRWNFARDWKFIIYRTRKRVSGTTHQYCRTEILLLHQDVYIIVARLFSTMISGWLSSLGQTHHILGSAEDGIVLSDEDIPQDPQAVTSTAEASAAAIVLRLSDGFSRIILNGGEV